MCIGLPMYVLSASPGAALCRDRQGQTRRIDTALVGDCASGDWLLVFLDAARERLDATRAAEIEATLAMLDAALCGDADASSGAVAFELPSAMSAEHLASLLGQPTTKEPS
ncbi:HypC/HybG/HupF family hydrogenase formation chaperone [Pseudomonas panipatensis]|uniref:Hydrogenase expression/formation protein HypC n=1 Tax=Pseudomonas panipatensis TaxID=428992 RepID=A0A1G8LK02_9PSED|nr:HypC/HybG/HupF family hydrogenase formation chaperone [Pseudomonas panipatensis]SDI55797.1 hydrogenase expression/formation protein HypC [Pseudomonas panipatensis]SMP74702.1 hydrogenase expression/formation protein HypC [Pseudomonas panipatensis]